MSRAGRALAAVLLLGGCNAVTTPVPLVPAESGVLKAGVWRADMEKGCNFDERQPIAQWPSCAVAPILQSQGAGRLVAKDRDPGSFDLRLVRGDPLLVQVTITSANDEDAAFRSLTFYLAGRPTRLDAKGQVTAAALWLVQCGPPAGGGEMTRNPLPGLTLDPQAKTCATDQPQVVRAAAKASEAWTDPDDLLRIRWLRDGDA